MALRGAGNVTGFVSFEYGLSAKWLELLKEIAPVVTRAAVIRDPDISAGTGQFGAIQTAAPSFGLDLIAVSPREAGELERAISSFARTPNGGLITTSSALAVNSPRSDHRACGQVQIARCLLSTAFRYLWRSNLLWP